MYTIYIFFILFKIILIPLQLFVNNFYFFFCLKSFVPMFNIKITGDDWNLYILTVGLGHLGIFYRENDCPRYSGASVLDFGSSAKHKERVVLSIADFRVHFIFYRDYTENTRDNDTGLDYSYVYSNIFELINYRFFFLQNCLYATPLNTGGLTSF